MLDNIQAFLDVHKAGTFSAAAKLHNAAVSSVSRQVDALEQALGVALFRRSSRRLQLTDAGEQFLPRAQLIVSEMVDAKAALLDAQAEPRGLLSVTATSVFWRMHIAPTIASFMRQYPLIELNLQLSDHWVDLSEQRADVAIRIGTLPDSDLLATRLAPMLRVAVASQQYIRAHGRPAKPEDLLQHSCLCLPSTPSGLWSFPNVNHNKPLPVQGRFCSKDVDSLLDAAADGLGVAHLASWLVYKKVAAGELVSLFPASVAAAAAAAATAKGPAPSIHAVRLKGRSHSAKAQLFINHLKLAFGAPPYWDR